MNARIKDLWTNDLETTDAPQAQLALFDGVGYCCLGRLCELHRQETGEGNWQQLSEGWWYNIPGNTSSRSSLPIAVREWAGLADSDPIIGERRASYYNDMYQKTFKEIAELIKQNVD